MSAGLSTLPCELTANDSIRGCEECQNACCVSGATPEQGDIREDEISLLLRHLVMPITQITLQIEFFGSPETRLGSLISLPYLCNQLHSSHSDAELTSRYFMGKRTNLESDSRRISSSSSSGNRLGCFPLVRNWRYRSSSIRFLQHGTEVDRSNSTAYWRLP